MGSRGFVLGDVVFGASEEFMVFTRNFGFERVELSGGFRVFCSRIVRHLVPWGGRIRSKCNG